MSRATQILDVLSLAHALQSFGRCRGPIAVRPRSDNSRPRIRVLDDRPGYEETWGDHPEAIEWCGVGALHAAGVMLGYSYSVELDALMLCNAVVRDRFRHAQTVALSFSTLNDTHAQSDEEVLSVYCDAAAKVNPK